MSTKVRKLQLVETSRASDLPSGEALEPSLRVAFATDSGRTVDAHFGAARKFAIYDVSARSSRFFGMAEFDQCSDGSGEHLGSEGDRIGHKVEALAGCSLLFVLAIGGPAAARVVGARIHPVKLPAPEPIDTVISRVRGMLAGTPPPWLRKAMKALAPRSMNFLEEEE